MHVPKEVKVDPDGIYIQWDDGHESHYGHRYLRAECRCAGCVNELTGERTVGYDNVDPDVEALDWMPVGRYALRFLWTDAHDTGIYPFVVLREVCPCPECTAVRSGESARSG